MHVFASVYCDSAGRLVYGSPFMPAPDGELRLPMHAEWEDTPAGPAVRMWGYPESDDVEPLRGVCLWTNHRQLTHRPFMVGLFELRPLSDDPWDDMDELIKTLV